ncbi:flagellar hook-basal body complex protein FliE [Acuticoccus sp. I52.16.1]|uniref:flagellar hook-basal body complex protein FliE n=1 Tax=Acuticoccus sp. I52.16.1 TaxID=2928472 RepID=UPI001FD40715|nr:flagellar hook-basal body complex protein FliE [Acuticoccus sp. I52.16.1]UOM34306.1 flagellar hook-basal body complex protein FliE [Acuticoccus sp. I52.16.1]
MMNVSPIGGAETGVRPIDPTGGGATVGDSFESMFAKIATNARDAMRAGEAAAISGVSGDSSVQEVVQSLMSAEEHLRAAVAVRDRVVSAYQEIARMQI